MLKYREFKTLTDKEIIDTLTDIFNAVKVENIRWHNEYEFFVDVTTKGWGDEDEEITDTLIVDTTEISCTDYETDDESFLWKQWLLSVGCNTLLKDNKWLGK